MPWVHTCTGSPKVVVSMKPALVPMPFSFSILLHASTQRWRYPDVKAPRYAMMPDDRATSPTTFTILAVRSFANSDHRARSPPRPPMSRWARSSCLEHSVTCQSNNQNTQHQGKQMRMIKGVHKSACGTNHRRPITRRPQTPTQMHTTNAHHKHTIPTGPPAHPPASTGCPSSPP